MERRILRLKKLSETTKDKQFSGISHNFSYIWYFRERDVRIGCLFQPQFSGNEYKSDITFRLP